MQWTCLEHNGPSMVTLKKSLSNEYCMLYQKKNNSVVQLDDTQRYLVYLYNKHYYLKVDLIFQRNFWKSLNTLFVQDDQVNIVCKVHKTPESFMDIERTRARMVLPSGEVLENETAPIESQPSIFVGRDPNHPKRGTCRRGICPSEVTINMSRNRNHRSTKERGFVCFVENKNVQWIARWMDPVTSDTRYIFMKSNVRLEKFEQARLLKRRLRILHHKQLQDIVHPSDTRRQIAFAVFLLEHLCIRVGNEKDMLTEADTIGTCTLKAYTNIFIKNHSAKKVCLKFIGKDSVPFHKTIVVPEPYFSQCERMLRDRPRDSVFFYRVSPSVINRYIHSVAPGCSAKTFRTLKASVTFQNCLKQTNDVREANKKVARLLNHFKGPRKDKLNPETSRKNYIDPRVYIAHCKRNKVEPKESWVSSHDPFIIANTCPQFQF